MAKCVFFFSHWWFKFNPVDFCFAIFLYLILYLHTYIQLGTLGEARGKLTLIQRFDYDLLPSHLTQRIGIHLGPTQWTDNGKAIEHTYNVKDGQVAYIQVNSFFSGNKLWIFTYIYLIIPPSPPETIFRTIIKFPSLLMMMIQILNHTLRRNFVSQ